MGVKAPVWSPAGSFIAYSRVVRVSENPRRTRMHLFKIRPDGTGETDLTPNSFDNCTSPLWLSDEEILYLHEKGGKSQTVYRVLNLESGNSAKWNISKPPPYAVVSDDGQWIVFVAAGPNSTGVLFMLEMNNPFSAARQITFDMRVHANRLVALTPERASSPARTGRAEAGPRWQSRSRRESAIPAFPPPAGAMGGM